jgi:hypothetical protein
MCKSCSRQCGCPCEPEDIILSAIGFPFCMRCEHPLALHDYKTSGEHPIPEHRMKAAAVPASEPIPGMPQPVYMEMR